VRPPDGSSPAADGKPAAGRGADRSPREPAATGGQVRSIEPGRGADPWGRSPGPEPVAFPRKCVGEMCNVLYVYRAHWGWCAFGSVKGRTHKPVGSVARSRPPSPIARHGASCSAGRSAASRLPAASPIVARWIVTSCRRQTSRGPREPAAAGGAAASSPAAVADPWGRSPGSGRGADRSPRGPAAAPAGSQHRGSRPLSPIVARLIVTRWKRCPVPAAVPIARHGSQLQPVGRSAASSPAVVADPWSRSPGPGRGADRHQVEALPRPGRVSLVGVGGAKFCANSSA
jgi:hypothetical protein